MTPLEEAAYAEACRLNHRDAVTMADIRVLDAKDPLTYTEADFAIYKALLGELGDREARARKAKRQAETTIIRKEVTPTAPPITVKSSIAEESLVELVVMTTHGALVPVFEQITALKAQIATMEAEIAALKATTTDRVLLADGGTWRTGMSYRRGDCITHRGGGWICLRDHTAAEFDHACWRLQSKSGHVRVSRDVVAAVFAALQQRDAE